VSIIEGASAGVKDMADGTLRITVEFEPRFAQMAYALFGARGTPLAVTALKGGYAAMATTPEPKPPEPEKPKGGKLAINAAYVCNSQEFQRFAAECEPDWTGSPIDIAARFMRYQCGIDSRSELDHSSAAAVRFKELMGQYRNWGETGALVA